MSIVPTTSLIRIDFHISICPYDVAWSPSSCGAFSTFLKLATKPQSYNYIIMALHYYFPIHAGVIKSIQSLYRFLYHGCVVSIGIDYRGFRMDWK